VHCNWKVKKEAKHPNPIFSFKHFDVDQTGCAMKINTDGVLLAALAAPRAISPDLILDIGTGTGVVAMMLAQRFKEAMVSAVEIDPSAAETAGRNFSNSIFSDRLTIYHTAIQEYRHPHLFDLIVSNPPYFVNDLKNAEEKKGMARHTDQLFFKELLIKVEGMLKPEGVFWFILPVKQAEMLVANAEACHLWPIKTIHLHSDRSKPAFRYIVCLGRQAMAASINEHFYIYESEKVYTKAYHSLLHDFFLRLGP
jgi:tRNA1Val (adenine37-N6)-methyltransferase